MELRKLQKVSKSFERITPEKQPTERKEPSPILKRMVTSLNNKGRIGNNVSFSMEDLASKSCVIIL